MDIGIRKDNIKKEYINQEPREAVLIQDVFRDVFSHFDLTDEAYQKAILVNKFWKVTILNIGTKEINLFLSLLGEKIGIELKSSDLHFNFSKSFSSLIENKVLNLLKDLAIKNLECLEKLFNDISKPKFFDKILFFAKEISKAKTSSSIDFYKLANISNKLIQMNLLESAKDMALLISNTLERSLALKLVVQGYIKKQQLDQAVVVANLIPIDLQKSIAILEIVKEYIKGVAFDDSIEVVIAQLNKAVEVAILTPSYNEKKFTLKLVSKEFVRRNIQDNKAEHEIAKMPKSDPNPRRIIRFN